MKHLGRVGVLAAFGLGIGVLIALFAPLGGADETSEVILGSFKVRTANATGQPRMTGEAASSAARAAADQRLTDTIAGLATINGRSLRVGNLRVAQTAFAPAAVEISSSVSTFRYRTNPPEDLWIFIYRTEGVEMPDWGISDGVVEVEIVINDQTGQLESGGVLRYNPNAQP